MDDHKRQKNSNEIYYDKVEFVGVISEGGMELVDTEESISLPKASFRPITVLGGGGGAWFVW